jgi:hypothetical protein
MISIKNGFEQKAFVLFNAYIAISLTLFGVAGAAYKSGAIPGLVWPFAMAGLMFVFGAALLANALMDDKYGALGSGPAMWLKKGTIDGEDSSLYVMLAYLTFHHNERIDISVTGNDRKAKVIRCGIFIGVFAPVALVATLLYV